MIKSYARKEKDELVQKEIIEYENKYGRKTKYSKKVLDQLQDYYRRHRRASKRL